MSLVAGQTLSHYEILGPLGAGGMGEVWRALDTRLERDVAIKVLPEHLAHDQERLLRFEREAKSLASLNHPSVAQIFGVDQVGDTYFLVLELVPGETLEDRIARGALPVEEVVDVGRQIADGLEAAHEAGVIHRDLKPANVRITPDGKVKVLDFGLAKPTGSEARGGSATDSVLTTEAGRLLGTPTYMAPEQVRGKPIDRRVDVWAFGCLLYECLSGERAFGGETLSDVLSAVLNDEPDWTRLPAATPAHVRVLLGRCLQKDPRRRLRDVGDAGLLLADPGAPAPAGSALAPRARGPRWLAAALAGVGAFLLGWLLRPAPPQAGVPRVTQLTFSGEDCQPHVSPDGRLIAFTSTRTGVSQIWLRQVVGGGEQPLTAGSDWRPRFTADGTAVTFIRSLGHSYAAYRVPVVGGEPRKLIDEVTEVDSSPDGRTLAFLRGAAVGRASRGSELGVLDLETGVERIVATFEGYDLLGLAWSPGGERLCATKFSMQGSAGEYRTLVVDPVSGEARELDVTGSRGLVSGAVWGGPSSLVLAVSPRVVSGTPVPSRIVRYDLRDGGLRELLWAQGLFPFRGSLNTSAQLALIDDHSLVFDVSLETQALHQVDLALGAGPGSRLLEGPATDRQPTYHPDGSRVLFTSNRTGSMDLFSYELASGRLSQLTDHPDSDWDGAYTPDGGSVLWGSNRSGNLEVWMADLDGAHPRQLTRDGKGAENPTMTRDGEWVVYSSSHPAHPGIYRIRPDGTENQVIAAGNWVNPEVSPDGRHVLYVATDNALLVNQVQVSDLETGEDTAFFAEIPFRQRSPNVTYGRGRWMPGGEAIVFLGLDAEGRTGLWVQDFDPGRDTSASRRPLFGFDGRLVYESFGIAPDGRRLTVSSIEQVRTINLADGLPDLR